MESKPLLKGEGSIVYRINRTRARLYIKGVWHLFDEQNRREEENVNN
jgi:hypothetical protein